MRKRGSSKEWKDRAREKRIDGKQDRGDQRERENAKKDNYYCNQQDTHGEMKRRHQERKRERERERDRAKRKSQRRMTEKRGQ